MARPPTLKPFDLLITKDRNAPSDKVQVPAAATVEFYLQGATAKPGSYQVTQLEDAEVPVWHLGTFKVGDDVLIDANPAKRVRVTAIDTANLTLWLGYISGPTVSFGGGARLFRDAARPSVYRDPTGQVSTGSPTLTVANGRASCYVPAFRFDYAVTITGTTIRRIYVDGVGSFVMRT